MATLPFLILAWWLACKFEIWATRRSYERDQLVRDLEKSKPSKYRVREVSPEDDELFLTDLGDFDEAFNLNSKEK